MTPNEPKPATAEARALLQAAGRAWVERQIYE
jgi:hypothetical protein